MTEHVAMWKLRRLNSRVRDTLERQAHNDILDQQGRVTVPSLTKFCSAYDDLRQSDIPWRTELQRGRAATYELVQTARMWMPLTVRDLPFIERANYLDSPICDDILDDVERLIFVLCDGRMADGQRLAYREHAIDALDTALRAASLKWRDAERDEPEYARQMASLRSAADEARTALRDFLRAAAFTLTYRSPDYLRLLPSRAGFVEATDDRSAPLPELIEPATLVTGVPQALRLQG